MASYKDQPGVYIYDSFEYPSEENMFMSAIIAEIDPIQYWRDRPLLINEPKGELANAVNLTAGDLIAVGGSEGAIAVFDEIQNLGPVSDQHYQDFEEAWKVLRVFDDFPDPPFPHVPWVDSGTYPGDFLSVISGEVPLGDPRVFDLIKDEEFMKRMTDYLEPTTPTDVKDSMEEYGELVADTIATYEPVFDQIDKITETAETHIDQAPDLIDPIAQWQSLGEVIPQWYGIPLINAGPQGVHTRESFLVQIDAKNDWKVSVLNAISIGSDRSILTIDKQIPPNKKFIVGMYRSYSNLGLVLKIEGDPKIYHKIVQLSFDSDFIPKVISYGVDNSFIKSLCGHMWEVLFWKQASNFNFNLPAPEPNYPDDGWVYDFRGPIPAGTTSYWNTIGGTIDGNRLGTINDHNPSARVGSGPTHRNASFVSLQPLAENVTPDFYGIHPWNFIYNSYIDNFFCRTKMQGGDFTIVWHQWLFQYPTGQHNFISDPIYSNYLSYNYDNFQVVLEFNGKRYAEAITLPEKVWAQFGLRYDSINNEIIFSFCDLTYFSFEEISFSIEDIGPNGLYPFEFQLDSMFARYNKPNKRYEEIHKGLFGMVMIHTEYKTTDYLIDLSEEIGNYLNQYQPQIDETTAP